MHGQVYPDLEPFISDNNGTRCFTIIAIKIRMKRSKLYQNMRRQSIILTESVIIIIILLLMIYIFLVIKVQCSSWMIIGVKIYEHKQQQHQ